MRDGDMGKSSRIRIRWQEKSGSSYQKIREVLNEIRWDLLDSVCTADEKELARILRRAKIPYQIVTDMHAWQLCHLAMVVPIADAYYEASDPENAGRDAALMRKTAKQIRNNLSAIAARKIRLSPGKMQVFRLLPVPLVGFVLGFVFRSRFGDRFMYQHSMKAPDEMRQLHEQFYRWLE